MLRKKKGKKEVALLSCPFCGDSFADVTAHLDDCRGSGGLAQEVERLCNEPPPPISEMGPKKSKPPAPTPEPTPDPEPTPSQPTRVKALPTPPSKDPPAVKKLPPPPKDVPPPPTPTTTTAPVKALPTPPGPAGGSSPESSGPAPSVKPLPIPPGSDTSSSTMGDVQRSSPPKPPPKSPKRQSSSAETDSLSPPAPSSGWVKPSPGIGRQRGSNFLSEGAKGARRVSSEGRAGDDSATEDDGGSEELVDSVPIDSWVADVLYDFEPINEGEIGLSAGDQVEVLDSSTPEWYYVKHGERMGYVPADYCQPASEAIEDSTEDASAEAELPAAVVEDVDEACSEDNAESDSSEDSAPSVPEEATRGRMRGRGGGLGRGRGRGRGQLPRAGSASGIQRQPQRQESAPAGHAASTPSGRGAALAANRRVQKHQSKVGKFASLRNFGGGKKKKQMDFTISRSEPTVVDVSAQVANSAAEGSPGIQRAVQPEAAADAFNDEGPVDQRTLIAREFLSTERHYVKVITTMEGDYKHALMAKIDQFGKDIKPADIASIFSNLNMICPINENLLGEIEKVVENWNEESCMGDIFMRVAPFLKMYTTYSNHYDESLAVLNRCMKNERFAMVVEEQDAAANLGSRLEGLLIAPIQRVPRYTLLLSEMKKHTPEDHADRELLQKSIPMMQEVGDYINTNITQAENQQKLLDLSMKGAKSLLKPHRVLLHEGNLKEKRENKMHVYLFNDILVHLPEAKVKNKANLNKPEYQWPLHLIWLSQGKTKKKTGLVTFEILGPSGSYSFTNLEESERWFDWVSEAFEGHLQYLTGTQDPELRMERDAGMTSNNPKRYGTFLFPTGQEYTGWWLDGKLHGKGTYTFMDGVYVGDFQNNLREGMGVHTYPSGDVYDGEWSKDRPNGVGTLTYANGDVYNGLWKDGKRNGKGELICSTSDSYIGEWADDLPGGLGEMYYSNGAVYNGNWLNGMRHHYGILILPDKTKYEGEWVAGIRQGKGRLEYADGSYFDGTWRDGLYHGTGKFVSAVLGTYEGEWAEGVKEGNGTMMYPNGQTYSGKFKRGNFHGHGILSMKYGHIESYEGEWVSQKKHGTGVLYFRSGDKYEGHFRDNYIHGTGIYTWKNGISLKCKWEKGKPVKGDCTYTPASDKKKKKEAINGTLRDGIITSDRPNIYVSNFMTSEMEMLW